MILVKKRILKKRFKKRFMRIYVNTIIPKFQFINKKGDVVKPSNICINL